MRPSVLCTAIIAASCFFATATVLAAPAQTPQADNKVPAPAAAAIGSKSSGAEQVLPKLKLTDQILYQYLVAEIALQRGDLALASDAYLDLAKDTRDPRIAKRATEVAIYAQRGHAAESASRLWLELEPQSMNARQALVAIMLSSNKPDYALPYLKQLLSAHPENAGAEFMQLGVMLSNQPDKAANLKLVQSLAQAYPDLPEAHLAIAQAAARAGQFDLALAQLDIADKLKPGWDTAAMLRFEVLSRNGGDKGMAFARDYLQRYPQANEVRLAYARYLLNRNDLEESRRQFELLAQALPGSAEMQLAIGLISLQMNELDAADAAFAKALQEHYAQPGVVQIYLGQVAEAQHRYNDAENWYRSVGPGPQYVIAQIKYAMLLAKQGHLDQARSYLHAVKVNDDAERVELIQAEAEMLREAHDDKAVYTVLGDALASRPDSIDLLYDHAMAAERLNHLDIMEADLRHLLKLQPDHAQALNALGYTLADHNIRLPEALNLLQEALKLAPNDAYILDSMGWAQYRVGNLPMAADFLSRAYSKLPDPEIAAHLGEVLWVQGKHDEARQVWEKALATHPKNQALLDVTAKYK
ncbi:MAG: tetratricopeptide repeat protein [Burkholderiales bacterium]